MASLRIPFVLTALIVLALERQPSASLAATCGNGRVEDGETCDDGNVFAGDCCSPQCLVEESYLGCAGQCLCDTCDDHEDNDGDALVDAEDPECATLSALHRVSVSARSGSLPPSATTDGQTISCLSAEPAIAAMTADAVPLCARADALARANAERVARLAGAPLDEIVAGRGQDEIHLSFDSGTTVLELDRLALGDGTRLRLYGAEDSTVLVQVTGAVEVGADVEVRLEGGLKAERMLWNLMGDAGAVTFGKGTHFPGTVLAPARVVALAEGAEVGGGLYAARVERSS